MPSLAKSTKATIIPVLRYRDAPVAIEWLCQTFGFEKNLVVPNEDGSIAHAQLSFGNRMIMLGSVPKQETDFGRLMKHPTRSVAPRPNPHTWSSRMRTRFMPGPR